MIPPNDPQALADRLERALKDPDRLATMGNAGREWYERERQAEEKKLQEMYIAVAEGKRRAAPAKKATSTEASRHAGG